MSYLAASIADACAYTMFRMAGDALACRLRRRLLHCTMHRDLHELAQVRACLAFDRFVQCQCSRRGSSKLVATHC
jgi:hypothetical protein